MESMDEQFARMRRNVVPEKNKKEVPVAPVQQEPEEEPEELTLGKMDRNLSSLAESVAQLVNRPLQTPVPKQPNIIIYAGFVLVVLLIGVYLGMQLVSCSSCVEIPTPSANLSSSGFLVASAFVPTSLTGGLGKWFGESWTASKTPV